MKFVHNNFFGFHAKKTLIYTFHNKTYRVLYTEKNLLVFSGMLRIKVLLFEGLVVFITLREHFIHYSE